MPKTFDATAARKAVQATIDAATKRKAAAETGVEKAQKALDAKTAALEAAKAKVAAEQSVIDRSQRYLDATASLDEPVEAPGDEGGDKVDDDDELAVV